MFIPPENKGKLTGISPWIVIFLLLSETIISLVAEKFSLLICHIIHYCFHAAKDAQSSSASGDTVSISIRQKSVFYAREYHQKYLRQPLRM